MRPIDCEIVALETRSLTDLPAGFDRQRALVHAELAPDAHAVRHAVGVGEIVIDPEVVSVRVRRSPELIVEVEFPAPDIWRWIAAKQRAADRIETRCRHRVVRELLGIAPATVPVVDIGSKIMLKLRLSMEKSPVRPGYPHRPSRRAGCQPRAEPAPDSCACRAASRRSCCSRVAPHHIAKVQARQSARGANSSDSFQALPNRGENRIRLLEPGVFRCASGRRVPRLGRASPELRVVRITTS